MMHGFGPAVLLAVPKVGGASARDIREAMVKQPDLSTIYTHLATLVRMGCVVKEGRLYRRLVDSELEGFVPASEVPA